MSSRARPPRPIPTPPGLKLVRGALTPAWRAAIATAWREGYTQREIAHAFDLALYTVNRVINGRPLMLIGICRRCYRERPISRKRELCDHCKSALCTQGKLDTYPAVLPPLPEQPPRPDRRQRLDRATRRALARLWHQGYGPSQIARAYHVSTNAVCEAVRWDEEYPQ